MLTKSKYYTAIGRVANAALSRVSYDILALVDIPEVESHRLSELCRILHAVEGLFVEDPAEVWRWFICGLLLFETHVMALAFFCRGIRSFMAAILVSVRASGISSCHSQ